jgi:GTP-binding protein
VAAKLQEMPRPAWAEPETAEEEEVVVPTRHVAAESQRFDVTQESKTRFRVSGERIERLVSMTDMNNPFALERMQRELDRMGISDALRTAGVEPGDTVAIGRVELEWSNEPWRAYTQTMPRREKKGPGKKHS